MHQHTQQDWRNNGLTNMKVESGRSRMAYTVISDIFEPLCVLEERVRKRFPPPASHSDLNTVLEEEGLRIALTSERASRNANVEAREAFPLRGGLKGYNFLLNLICL